MNEVLKKVQYTGIFFSFTVAILIVCYSSADATDQLSADTVLAVEADPDYGEYLAGECMTCHTGANTNESIPDIAGLPPATIVEALLEYKYQTRENETMRSIASAMGKDEIAALAAYFSAQTQ